MAEKFTSRTSGLFPKGTFTRGVRDPSTFRINTKQPVEFKDALKMMNTRIRAPKGKPASKEPIELDGKNWSTNLFRIAERIASVSLSFSAVTTLRAKKVFQDSFVHKRFYSSGGDAWPELSKFTIKKRISKKTWPGAGGMLMEYGDMFKSIQIHSLKTSGMRGYGVYTNPEAYTHGKRKGFVYAGIHNNPSRSDTYGDGFHGAITPKRVIKRQFMGHSSYIEDFIRSNIDRYMFYEVFK